MVKRKGEGRETTSVEASLIVGDRSGAVEFGVGPTVGSAAAAVAVVQQPASVSVRG